MARFAFLTLASLCLASFGAAMPMEEQVAIQGAHTMDSWSYTDCGLPTDPIQIQSIKVSPDPPQPGKDLTVTVNAEVLERIEDGAYADVTVKLGLIKLLSKSFDICEEAKNANASVQCPIEKGKYEVKETVSLPKEIPRAKFTVNVRAYTFDDDDLACLDLKVDFMKNPFPRKLW